MRFVAYVFMKKIFEVIIILCITAYAADSEHPAGKRLSAICVDDVTLRIQGRKSKFSFQSMFENVIACNVKNVQKPVWYPINGDVVLKIIGRQTSSQLHTWVWAFI